MPTSLPHLRHPPVFHLDPFLVNLESLATSPTCEGDNTRIVSSACSKIVQVFCGGVSSPYHHVHMCTQIPSNLSMSRHIFPPEQSACRLETLPLAATRMASPPLQYRSTQDARSYGHEARLARWQWDTAIPPCTHSQVLDFDASTSQATHSCRCDTYLAQRQRLTAIPPCTYTRFLISSADACQGACSCRHEAYLAYQHCLTTISPHLYTRTLVFDISTRQGMRSCRHGVSSAQ